MDESIEPINRDTNTNTRNIHGKQLPDLCYCAPQFLELHSFPGGIHQQMVKAGVNRLNGDGAQGSIFKNNRTCI